MIGAFLAPPFTGLDTLPSLGIVLLSLGVLLEDFVVVVVGLIVGVTGVVLEVMPGSAACKRLGSLSLRRPSRQRRGLHQVERCPAPVLAGATSLNR